MTHEIDVKEAHEMLQATMEFGRLGVRAVFLLNGGAIIGILTFIGHIYSSPNVSPFLHSAKLSLPYYILGVVCAALTLGVSYISQGNFYVSKWTSIAQETVNTKLADYDKQEIVEYVSNAMDEVQKKHLQIGKFVRWFAMMLWVASLALFLVGSYIAYQGMPQ